MTETRKKLNQRRRFIHRINRVSVKRNLELTAKSRVIVSNYMIKIFVPQPELLRCRLKTKEIGHGEYTKKITWNRF